MTAAANGLVLLVAMLHFWFLVLEMILWKKPLGLKTFKNSLEKAELTAVLAANQGLYNGFLAGGLFFSLVAPSSEVAFSFQLYFLVCVVIAGLYGAWSVSRRVLFIQALPAALALGLVVLSR